MSTDVTAQQTTLSDRVAEEVRAMLARRRISGRELARRLGVSPNWVSLRLSGHQTITVDDIDRIADALDVTVVDLFPRDRRQATDRYPANLLSARTPALTRPPDRRPGNNIHRGHPNRAVRRQRDTASPGRRSVATALARLP